MSGVISEVLGFLVGAFILFVVFPTLCLLAAKIAQIVIRIFVGYFIWLGEKLKLWR